MDALGEGGVVGAEALEKCGKRRGREERLGDEGFDLDIREIERKAKLARKNQRFACNVGAREIVLRGGLGIPKQDRPLDGAREGNAGHGLVGQISERAGEGPLDAPKAPTMQTFLEIMRPRPPFHHLGRTTLMLTRRLASRSLSVPSAATTGSVAPTPRGVR